MLGAPEGEFRRRSAADQDHLVLFAAYAGNGESDRRVNQLHDHIDTVLIEPSPSSGHPGIRLVLEIGSDNRDAHVFASGELLHRLTDAGNAGRPDRVPVVAWEIGEHTDAD